MISTSPFQGKFVQEHCLFCHHQIGEDCWELYNLMIQKKQKNETRGTKDEDISFLIF